MAADPAFFHRDGSGKFHAYDAATNALAEEAYRTQKTCRLPVRGMHSKSGSGEGDERLLPASRCRASCK